MVARRNGVQFLAVLAVSACASAGPGAARLRTDRVGPAFAEVRTAVVFRPDPRPERHGKDLADGVAESLAARGWTVTQAEPSPAARKALERLRAQLDPWMGPALDARQGVVFGVAEGAGELVREAGVDAVAFTYRFVRMPAAQQQSVYAPPRTDLRALAVGAIVLVSARDEVARVEWGGDARQDLGTAPANAAEAIDALMLALDAEKEPPPPPGEGPAPVVSPPGAGVQSREPRASR